jgi:hypothetical protein
VQVLLTFASAVGTGAVAGIVWERLWTPPSGVALAHKFVLDGQGLPEDFSGTGLYVLVAGIAGLLLGLATGLVFRARELATLVTLLVGAALAGWVMAQVGQALGPPDPAALAKGLEDFAPLTPDLRLQGFSPYLILPFGALLGLAAEYLLEVLVRGVPAPDEDPMATLDA